MTIDEAIEQLKSEKAAGIKNVIMAWWTADAFGRVDDAAWAHDAALIERKMDWSAAHDDIMAALDIILSDNSGAT